MRKLPPLKSREITRVLEKMGFKEHRQKGSHKIFKKENLRVTVPIHNRDLKKGTIRSIVGQSGSTEDEFLELLK